MLFVIICILYFHIRTVHLDSIKVIYSPTNAQIFFFNRRYNPRWVLACFTIPFHNFQSLHFSLQFLTFIFFKSSSTWSSHLNLGKCTNNSLKNSIKIYIKIAPTCFGAVTPSSGSALSMLAKVTLC
jgi:hypothetical protein